MATTKPTQAEHLAIIGAGAYASIVEMVAALNCDYDRRSELREELIKLNAEAGECEDRDVAEDQIKDDALSVRVFGERVNGEWEADKFEILLTTGGPAVRIMGELDGGEPCRAWLETQDWGTPWAQYFPADQGTLLAYARCFYFGE